MTTKRVEVSHKTGDTRLDQHPPTFLVILFLSFFFESCDREMLRQRSILRQTQGKGIYIVKTTFSPLVSPVSSLLSTSIPSRDVKQGYDSSRQNAKKDARSSRRWDHSFLREIYSKKSILCPLSPKFHQSLERSLEVALFLWLLVSIWLTTVHSSLDSFVFLRLPLESVLKKRRRS